MGILFQKQGWHPIPKWGEGLRRLFSPRPPKNFDPSGFPLSAPKAWQKALRAWMTHPSEFLACLIFLLFIFLSLVTWGLGRAWAWESLRYSLGYGVLWFLWMAYVVYFLPRSSRTLQFVRDFGPWVAVMLSYNWVRYLIPAVHPSLFDQKLRLLEMRLWGWDAAFWTKALSGHPYWTDFSCLLYLGLFFWMFGILFYYAFARHPLYQRFMLGLMLIYLGGFVGYMFFPAAGPRYAFPQEWSWLNGGTLFNLTNLIVSHMGAKLDVFPSLHAALSIYLLFWQAEHHKVSVAWAFPLTLGIWVSTILLGFHYFPDLLGGGLLGGLAFFAAPRLEARFNHLRDSFGRV